MTKDRYHHGDLRSALLVAAAEQIAEEGVDAVSMRALARRCGVSHAAPTHHFTDRRGLFTALATQGFELLADDLASAGPDLVDVGLAYVRSVLAHPGHFDVMFRADLIDPANPELAVAQERASAQLRAALGEHVGAQRDDRATRLAAWSIAHGFASLWRSGVFGEPADAASAGNLAGDVLRRVRFQP